MKCKDAEIQVLLQESGELSGGKTKALADHLQTCADCLRLKRTVSDARKNVIPDAEPGAKTMQAVLREARLQAPEKKLLFVFGLKPALTLAAGLVLAIGLFSFSFSRDKVGMELVMAESQLLEPEGQVASVMYNGLSEDDLAFNFLMSY